MNTRTEYNLEAIKSANPLPDFLRGRGVTLKKSGTALVGLCPFHQEKTPSFYVWDHHAHCYGCGWHGDVVDAYREYTGVEFGTACEDLGGVGVLKESVSRLSQPVEEELEPVWRPIEWPSELRPLTDGEIDSVARSRELDPRGVKRAQDARTLAYGNHEGFDSWILADRAHRAAEARRIDREVYPRTGKKADSLRGSKKDWLVGAGSPEFIKARSLIIVEGGPDALAVHHLAVVYGKPGLYPLAVLGQGTKRAHPECLGILTGKQVTILPDIKAKEFDAPWVQAWSAIANEQGARSVSVFNLYTATEDETVTDLNDLIISNHIEAINALLFHVS